MSTGYWLFGSLAVFPLVVKWVGDLLEYIDDQVELRMQRIPSDGDTAPPAGRGRPA